MTSTTSPSAVIDAMRDLERASSSSVDEEKHSDNKQTVGAAVQPLYASDTPTSDSSLIYDAAREKALIRKVDLMIVPTVAALYLFRLASLKSTIVLHQLIKNALPKTPDSKINKPLLKTNRLTIPFQAARIFQPMLALQATKLLASSLLLTTVVAMQWMKTMLLVTLVMLQRSAPKPSTPEVTVPTRPFHALDILDSFSSSSAHGQRADRKLLAWFCSQPPPLVHRPPIQVYTSLSPQAPVDLDATSQPPPTSTVSDPPSGQDPSTSSAVDDSTSSRSVLSLPVLPQIPTLASWNLSVARPVNFERVKERTAQFDIKAWLFQEWNASRRSDKDMAWASRPGQRLFCGPRTAILLMDSEWQIVKAASHTEHSSRISIRIPGQDVVWHILSVYLPALATDRLELTKSTSFGRDLQLADLSPSDLERTIVMGDFNDTDGPLDRLNFKQANGSSWPRILAAFEPLIPVYRHLYPTKIAYSWFRAKASNSLPTSTEDVSFSSYRSLLTSASRIDHVFVTENLRQQIAHIWYLSEPGASDHCIQLLSGRPTLADNSTVDKLRPTWWMLDHLSVSSPWFQARIRSLLNDLPSQASARHWQRHIKNVQVILFHDSRTMIDRRVLPSQAAFNLRNLLDSTELTADNLVSFIDLACQYEMARAKAFPVSQLDTLRMQPDITVWPSKDKPRSNVPIPADEVYTFFRDLYASSTEGFSVWYRRSLKFLRHSQVFFYDTTALAADFTESEVSAALAATKKGSSPGPNGLSYEVLKCGGTEFLSYLARCVNNVLEDGGSFPSASKSSLLFKNKPGMSRENVSDYRLISVLDSDLRLIHSLLSRRIHDDLQRILPWSQVGFMSGRQSSNVTVRLFILAEANRRKLLVSPGLHISQDQKKAYDKIHRSWIRLVLVNARCPDRLLRLYDALMADTSAVIKVDTGFTPNIKLLRGLLQGAPSSVILYILAYQPFLDAWAATRSGIKIRLNGQIHKLTSASYADNSEIFIGGPQDLHNYQQVRKTFDELTGSELNTAESSARLVGQNSDGSHWYSPQEAPFPVLPQESEFKTVGRFVRLDGQPPQTPIEKLSTANVAATRLMRRYCNVFTAAHYLQSHAYAKVQLMFEGPIDRIVLTTNVSHHRRLFFRDGNGTPFRNEILTYPKRLGGLGLLDFVVMAECRLMFSVTQALTCEDSPLSACLGDLLTHSFREQWHRSIATIIAAPSLSRTAHLKMDDQYSPRILACLQDLQVDVSPSICWDDLSPEEVAGLPFFSKNYAFLRPLALDDQIAVKCAELGLSSFAEFLWIRPEQPPLTIDDFATHLRRPTLYDACGYANNKLHAAYASRSTRAAAPTTQAFKELNLRWFDILGAWPTALKRKLLSFIHQSSFEAAPLRSSPTLIPIKARQSLPLPWRFLQLAGVNFAQFTPKVGMAFLQPSEPLRPGVDPIRVRDTNRDGNIDVWVEDDDDDSLSSTSNASAWRRLFEWVVRWTELHRYCLPGRAREVWYYVLWARAPMPRYISFRRAPCYGCQLSSPSCDHVYLTCPNALKVWRHLGACLADLLGVELSMVEPFLTDPSAEEVVSGFPRLASTLDDVGKIRLRLWFVVTLQAYADAITNVRRLSKPRTQVPSALTPPRIQQTCVKRILLAITTFRFGPRVFSFEVIERTWFAGNRLQPLAQESSLHAARLLLPVHSDTGEDPDWMADDLPPPDPAEAPSDLAGPSSSSTSPVWLFSKLSTCLCCNIRRAFSEQTSRTCINCYYKRTGILPPVDLQASQGRIQPCPKCQAPALTRAEQVKCFLLSLRLDPTDKEWTSSKTNRVRCKCCFTNNVIDERRRLCPFCFFAHVGSAPAVDVGTVAYRTPSTPCHSCGAASGFSRIQLAAVRAAYQNSIRTQQPPLTRNVLQIASAQCSTPPPPPTVVAQSTAVDQPEEDDPPISNRRQEKRRAVVITEEEDDSSLDGNLFLGDDDYDMSEQETAELLLAMATSRRVTTRSATALALASSSSTRSANPNDDTTGSRSDDPIVIDTSSNDSSPAVATPSATSLGKRKAPEPTRSSTRTVNQALMSTPRVASTPRTTPSPRGRQKKRGVGNLKAANAKGQSRLDSFLRKP